LTDLAKSFAPFGWFTLLASVQSSLLFAAFAEVALGCKPTFRTLRFSLPANLGSIAVIWCCSVVWSLAIAPLNFLRSFEFHQVGRQCVEFRLHKRLAALGHPTFIWHQAQRYWPSTSATVCQSDICAFLRFRFTQFAHAKTPFVRLEHWLDPWANPFLATSVRPFAIFLLCTQRTFGLCFNLNSFARRFMRLAASPSSRERGKLVLYGVLFPHGAGALAQFFSAHFCLGFGGFNLPRPNGNSIYGLRASVGPNVSLGRDCDYQPTFNHSFCWPFACSVSLGRFQGFECHAQLLLFSPLCAALCNSCACCCSFGFAPFNRQVVAHVVFTRTSQTQI